MNWAKPTLTVSASDFGRTNAQAVGYYGRQLQYSARLRVLDNRKDKRMRGRCDAGSHLPFSPKG